MGSYQMLLHWVRADLGVIAMKVYSTLLRAPELEQSIFKKFLVKNLP